MGYQKIEILLLLKKCNITNLQSALISYFELGNITQQQSDQIWLNFAEVEMYLSKFWIDFGKVFNAIG